MSDSPIRAGIILIGNELTRGIIADANGPFIAGKLHETGISPDRICMVPDVPEKLENEMRRCIEETDLIVVAGGLGPTADDITRYSVSAVAGKRLEEREEIWDSLRRFYGEREIPGPNRRQTLVPEGFTVIPNKNGTAPGFYGDIGEATVIVLPGPPGELVPMFGDRVLPLIQKRFDLKPEMSFKGTSFLVPESKLEQAFQDCCSRGVTWNTRIEEDKITFRLYGSTAERRRESFIALQNCFSPHVIREGTVDPVLSFFNTLDAKGYKVAGAESCTGGLISKMITEVAGSSRIFWGSFVTYDNHAKTVLGVDSALLEKHGAVSREAVTAMVEAVGRQSGVECGYAVSGIAGPEGGMIAKPVGTVWIACAVPGKKVYSRCFGFHGTRSSIRIKAAVATMILVVLLLTGDETLDSGGFKEYI